MLTVVDRPLIQYAVDEAREAGIEQMIFVTAAANRAWSIISSGFELEATWSGPERALITCTCAGQVAKSSGTPAQPLGSAMRSGVRVHVGDEPFAVLLPDDLMVGTPGALKQMVDAYAELGAISSVPGGAGGQDRQLASSPPAPQGPATEVKGLSRSPSRRLASRLAWSAATILQPN